MKMTIKIRLVRPHDCKLMTDRYLINNGGICGQACISSIMNTSVKWVLDEWKEIGLEWKGWSGWKQLKEFLEKHNYIVKQEKSEIDYLEGYYYIARVQWIGEGNNKEKPFFGYKHWSEATANTHFISITRNEFFCNNDGIFRTNELTAYLEFHNGIITSHFRIEKPPVKEE